MEWGDWPRFVIGVGESAADLLDRAEDAGLVVVPWDDGTTSVFGNEDSDESLMREVVRRGAEIAIEIDRRTPTSEECHNLRDVKSRHRAQLLRRRTE